MYGYNANSNDSHNILELTYTMLYLEVKAADGIFLSDDVRATVGRAAGGQAQGGSVPAMAPVAEVRGPTPS